jgi:hypothetical protein
MAVVTLKEIPRWLAEYEPALANLSGVTPPIQRLLVTHARLEHLRLLDHLAVSPLSTESWPWWVCLPARFIRTQFEAPTGFGMVAWEEDGWPWQDGRN